MNSTEKWAGIGFMLLVFSIGFMAWKSADMRQNCRIEIVKAGKSADDAVKVCP
jgi:hypothetical protein